MVSNAKDKRVGGRRGKSIKLSTDAQSIAARQRRHRISERFKILQSLVPGGSKMDTVSMLEEAINYVKFLKTQIWLHQSMINSVDADPKLSFPPINRPLEQNHDLLTQQNTDDYEVNAMPQLEVSNSASPN